MCRTLHGILFLYKVSKNNRLVWKGSDRSGSDMWCQFRMMWFGYMHRIWWMRASLGVYIIFWKLVEVGLWAESFSRSSSVRLSWSSLSEWWKIRFDLLWADKSAIWRLGLVSSSLAQGRFGVGQYRVPRFHAPNGASFGEWIRIFVWVPFDDWKCVQTGIEI